MCHARRARDRQVRFVAPLGHGEELLCGRRVPQFPHRAQESIDGHQPTLHQSDDTQFVWTTR